MENQIDISDIYIISSKNMDSGFQGLCSTCNNSLSCIFYQNLSSFIWQCDEFDNSTSEKLIRKNNNNISESLNISNATATTNKNTNKNKGLCFNCKNCNTCSYTPVEGGIWHCEDYM